MMFKSAIFSALCYLTFSSQSALSLPLAAVRAQNDVWDPRIISPSTDTIWHSGETQTITWDTSDAPVQITNGVGFVTLRYSGIETPVILAKDFQLLDGKVDVTVPEVFSRNDFSIVLFGDSGNWSPDFQIVGVDTD